MTNQSAEVGAPLIRACRISGLHGYKDIEINFDTSARIVIAENGSGKTTVLTAISCFLKRDFLNLHRLPIESIECEFTSGERVSLNIAEIVFPETTHPIVEELIRYSEFTESEFMASLFDDTSAESNQMIHEIYINSPYSSDELQAKVEDIKSLVQEGVSPQVKEAGIRIEQQIGKLAILHLPTYRRIEVPLKKPKRRRRVQPWKLSTGPGIRGSSSESLGESSIRYGLSDVEDRLSELVQHIQRISNMGYRQISAAIIDELISGIGGDSATDELPDPEVLKIFLSRVDNPGNNEARANRLSELFSQGHISDPSNQTLRYFLSKLAVVVKETQELEANIEKFVKQVNSYLEMSSEEKRLSYEPTEMRVEIRNEWTGSTVAMNDLSSGEKQMISLFSYLYLYQSKNIVLIDEPELSLSIEWQRKLLPDVIKAPTCAQLLAITHSPFIFDNELDPFAGPMHVSRRKV